MTSFNDIYILGNIGSVDSFSHDRQKNIISTFSDILWIGSIGNLNKNKNLFIEEPYIWKYRLQNGGHFVQVLIA